jgi:hypothetical protein
LVGTGDSGKSTFLKQMKVIHSNGFTKSEIEQFREVLRDNVMTVIAALINGCQNLNIQIPDKYEVIMTYSHKNSFYQLRILKWRITRGEILPVAIESIRSKKSFNQ